MVKKCINNHFYDGSRFPMCPYCGAKDIGEDNAANVPQTAYGASEPRQSFGSPKPEEPPYSAPYAPMPSAFTADDDDDATIPIALYKKRTAPAYQAPSVEIPEYQVSNLSVAAGDDDSTVPISAMAESAVGVNPDDATELTPASDGKTAADAPAEDMPADRVSADDESIRELVNEEAADGTVPMVHETGESSHSDGEEDKTVSIAFAGGTVPEFMPEQISEEIPSGDNEIASLVADAMASDKAVNPDVTEAPTAEDISAASVFTQREQAVMNEQSASGEEPFSVEAESLVSEAMASDNTPDPDVTEQPSADEIAAADAFMQQEMPVSPEMSAQTPMPPEMSAQTPMQYEQPSEMSGAYATYQGGMQARTVYPDAYGYGQSVSAPDRSGEPTVGWLVGLNDEIKGRIFDLKAGRSFIGRTLDMDISIPDDNALSLSRHAAVIYDPQSRSFIAQAGTSEGLLYVNDELVLNDRELSAYDRLTVGNSKLLFFPLCSEAFAWEDLEG